VHEGARPVNRDVQVHVIKRRQDDDEKQVVLAALSQHINDLYVRRTHAFAPVQAAASLIPYYRLTRLEAQHRLHELLRTKTHLQLKVNMMLNIKKNSNLLAENTLTSPLLTINDDGGVKILVQRRVTKKQQVILERQVERESELVSVLRR
jgi:hypothetical protein